MTFNEYMASVMPGYLDPGDTTGRPTYSSTPAQQQDPWYGPPARVFEALQAIIPGMMTGKDPGRWTDEERADNAMNLGMGATGPLAGGVLKQKPGRYGQTVLESWRGKPETLKGELVYFPGNESENFPPVFQSIWSESPLALGELFKGLETRLGGRLNEMELSDMVPQAVPFWEKTAKHPAIKKYPGLAANIEKGTKEAREYYLEESIPKKTYGYAKGAGNPWGSAVIPEWNPAAGGRPGELMPGGRQWGIDPKTGEHSTGQVLLDRLNQEQRDAVLQYIERQAQEQMRPQPQGLGRLLDRIGVGDYGDRRNLDYFITDLLDRYQSVARGHLTQSQSRRKGEALYDLMDNRTQDMLRALPQQVRRPSERDTTRRDWVINRGLHQSIPQITREALADMLWLGR